MSNGDLMEHLENILGKGEKLVTSIFSFSNWFFSTYSKPLKSFWYFWILVNILVLKSAQLESFFRKLVSDLISFLSASKWMYIMLLSI